MLPGLIESAETIIADKGYDATERVVAKIETAGKTAVIPSKSTAIEPRQTDWHLYKRRHLIENFFARLKQYRAIATRYDKRATIFLGAIYLAATITWLN